MLNDVFGKLSVFLISSVTAETSPKKQLIYHRQRIPRLRYRLQVPGSRFQVEGYRFWKLGTWNLQPATNTVASLIPHLVFYALYPLSKEALACKVLKRNRNSVLMSHPMFR
jgi:hypothetical protein